MQNFIDLNIDHLYQLGFAMSSNLNIMDDLTSNFEAIKVSKAASSEYGKEGGQSSYNDGHSTAQDNESNIDADDPSLTGTLLGLMNDQDLAEISNVQNDV